MKSRNRLKGTKRANGILRGGARSGAAHATDAVASSPPELKLRSPARPKRRNAARAGYRETQVGGAPESAKAGRAQASSQRTATPAPEQ